MNKRLLFSLMSMMAIVSMLLAACQPAPAPTEAPAPVQTEAPAPVVTEAPEPAFKACQVTDTGGIDDKSFNATAWKGVTDAQAQLGIEGKYLESQQQTDYEKNINAFIEDKCDIIVTVGFLLGDATKAAAEANPDTEVLDRRLRLRPDHPERSGTGLLYRSGWLPGWLCGGWRQQDRQDRHLRRHPDSAGDRLHGRLCAGRQGLQ